MLYRTHHHPFFSPFNPFTFSSCASSSSSLSSAVPPPLPPSPVIPSSSQAVAVEKQEEKEMECALKSSFRPAPEMTPFKTTPFGHNHQAFMIDDFWGVNSNNNGPNAEDFFVDDLLDFSDDLPEDQQQQQQDQQHQPKQESPEAAKAEQEEEEQEEEQAEEENDKKIHLSAPVSPSPGTFSLKDTDFSKDLSLPAEEMESLEWLSHFVEDSFTEYSLTLPPKPTETRSEPERPLHANNPCFTIPIQTKARTKRARTGMRVWSLGSASFTESASSTTSSSSTSSSTTSSSPNMGFVYPSLSQTAESLFGKPGFKKPKKKLGAEGLQQQQQPRRCSHCGVQKTPQWRAGPLGAKTLCNACGVRYKSGRLLPEYRPACSPTFSSELHSNNHRKVLEMRRKKEVDSGLNPPVQSF